VKNLVHRFNLDLNEGEEKDRKNDERSDNKRQEAVYEVEKHYLPSMFKKYRSSRGECKVCWTTKREAPLSFS